MKPKTEKQIPFILWGILVGIIVFISTCSCSVQSEFAKQENRLCTPDYKYYKITYITDKRIYLENYPSDYVTRSKKDTTSYKVGGEILIPIQFTWGVD